MGGNFKVNLIVDMSVTAKTVEEAEELIQRSLTRSKNIEKSKLLGKPLVSRAVMIEVSVVNVETPLDAKRVAIASMGKHFPGSRIYLVPEGEQ